MKGKLIALGIGILIIGLFIAGRSGSSTAPSAPRGPHGLGSQSANISRGTRQKERAALAPDFELQKLNGDTISIADYRGVKPVVLDFWASWCPNCRRDMPKLSQLYEKYGDQVEVIGINLQEKEDKIREFIDSRNITFPIALDPAGRTSRSYSIQYTNTHVLIDKEGNIARSIPGDIRESDIVSLIKG